MTQLHCQQVSIGDSAQTGIRGAGICVGDAVVAVPADRDAASTGTAGLPVLGHTR